MLQRAEEPDRILFWALLALLVWMPLPFGSDTAWSSAILEIWIFVIAFVWLIQYFTGRVSASAAFRRAWPLTCVLAAFALWHVVQVLQLPTGSVQFLSPRAAQIEAETLTSSRLSLEPFATHRNALLSLGYVLVFSLALLLVRTRTRIRQLAVVLIVGGTFQAAYGALMTLSGLEYSFFLPKTAYLGVSTGTFVNRNHFAGYLEMSLAISIGLMLADLSRSSATSWRDSARRMLRTLLGSKARVRLAIVIMATALVLTHSRMGNIAFFSSLCAVGAFYVVAVRGLSGRTIAFFASLLLVDLIVVGNFFGIEQVAERIQETSIEAEQRSVVYADTLDIIRDFAATGTGGGSFYAVYPLYTSQAPESVSFDRAHNDYLQFAAEYGVPMTALLGVVVLVSLWAALRAQLKRRDRLLQGMAFASSMGIVALLMHSATDFNLQIPANATLFMVLLALAWVCRCWDRREPSGPSPSAKPELLIRRKEVGGRQSRHAQLRAVAGVCRHVPLNDSS